MPIIISDSLVLGTVDNPTNTPIFLWESILTTGVAVVDASSEDADHPAANLSNPITAQYWAADEADIADDIYLTVSIISVTPVIVDAVGLAVHNFGSGQNVISVEGTTDNLETGSPQWSELVQEQLLANDDPVILRFTPQSLTGLRLKIQPSSTLSVPYLSVMYVGKLLVCERGTHADHVPITFGRDWKQLTNMSESGHFLDRILTSESRSTRFDLKLIRQTWYRQNMDAFIDAAKLTPFFFAWRPQTYPADVGYCWLTQPPQPAVHFETGRVIVSFEMNGIAASVG